MWSSTLRATPVTRVLTRSAPAFPTALWRSRPVLAGMGVMAGAALRAGRVGLTGRAPNGQRFVANPLQVWLVATATASLGGTDLGPPGPLPDQSSLGDFRIPAARGVRHRAVNVRGRLSRGRPQLTWVSVAARGENPSASTRPPEERRCPASEQA